MLMRIFRGNQLVSTVLMFAVHLLAVAAVRADVVVSNLGETETGVAAIFGLDPSLATATQFTTGPGAWKIDSVTARLNDAVGLNPDAMELQIRDDDGGNPGATVLGVFDMSANNIIEGNYTYSPLVELLLAGNTNYWLVGLPTFLDAQHGWSVTTSPNDNGILGWSIGNLNRSSGDLGATWIPNGNEPGMFSISATAVPEPSTLALAGIGAGAVVAQLARRRRTKRSNC